MSNDRYDLESKSSPFSKMRLLYVSTARFGGDWHSTPHTHACLELFYCVRGGGFFLVNSRRIPVGPDDFVIVNPGIDHTEIGSANAPLEYIVLGVDGVEILLDEKQENFCSYSFKGVEDGILPILTSILKEIELKLIGHETICRNLLEILLIRILRHTSVSIQPIVSQRSSKECTEAKHYMDTNYPENITLDFLADLTHVNKYYLVHAFHKEYNISPINYLISRRIKESKYLLSNTNHSLSQISHLLGFSSPSYFSQSFKRIVGITAAEYRKQNKNVTPQTEDNNGF